MQRLKNLFRQPEFHTLLFCLGFIAFNWLFWGLFSLRRPESVFIYLFLNWGIAIFFLFIMSKSCSEPDPEKNDEPAKDN